MLNSLLVATFRSLDKQERRALRKWVDSPFFNQRSDVQRLFEYLCEHVPVGTKEPPASSMEKAVVFREVFPPTGKRTVRKYRDTDMRYAMSFLYQAIKQYLAYSHWALDGVDVGRHLCKSLRQRGLDQVFEKEYGALSTQLGQARCQSVDFFFQQYHLELERWEIFRRNHRSASDILANAGLSRNAYFAAETLRQACAVLAQPGEQLPAAESIYLPTTITAVEAGKFAETPAVQAYFHCYKILSEQDAKAEPHFAALHDLLAQYWALFPANEIRDLYVGAINYCIRRLNSGSREYIRSALDLYRSGLERAILLEDGYLNKYTYNNILLLALALEDWDWAQGFLEEYKPMLPPRDRESAWQYNLARYYFRKKEYGRAQEILRGVEFRDVFYNLDARRMLVRIYFDTDETGPLESLLDSFSVYLQRKRASLGYHKQLNQNFVRFVKRLLRARPGDIRAQERLQEQIQSTPYVAEREWLLEKCR